jgi:hypothetical protein
VLHTSSFFNYCSFKQWCGSMGDFLMKILWNYFAILYYHEKYFLKWVEFFVGFSKSNKGFWFAKRILISKYSITGVFVMSFYAELSLRGPKKSHRIKFYFLQTGRYGYENMDFMLISNMQTWLSNKMHPKKSFLGPKTHCRIWIHEIKKEPFLRSSKKPFANPNSFVRDRKYIFF